MDGVQRFGTLVATGMARSQVDALPRVGGLRGLRLLAAADDDDPRMVRIHAALDVAPRGAVLSGWAAGVVHGIPGDMLDGTWDGAVERPVELIVPMTRGQWQRKGVRLWRGPVATADTLPYRGAAITSSVRTAVDLARWSKFPPRALAMLDMSLRHGLTDPAELAAYLPLLKGYRGIALVREAAPLISARAESPKESELRHYWLEAGLPPPLVNAEIYDPEGFLVGRVDLLEPESGYCAEFDGHWHRMWGRPEADARRAGRLTALNLTMDVFTRSDLGGKEFATLLARLVDGQRRALARDRRHDAWHCPQHGV
jgi:hypothetical protein